MPSNSLTRCAVHSLDALFVFSSIHHLYSTQGRASLPHSAMRLSTSVVFASLFLSAAYGHGVITNVQGDNGATGAGFGVIADTPRDGSRANPFQVRGARAGSGWSR